MHARNPLIAQAMANAILIKDIKHVRMLLENGVNANFAIDGWTGLGMAVMCDAPDIADALLKHRANPLERCHYPGSGMTGRLPSEMIDVDDTRPSPLLALQARLEHRENVLAACSMTQSNYQPVPFHDYHKDEINLPVAALMRAVIDEKRGHEPHEPMRQNESMEADDADRDDDEDWGTVEQEFDYADRRNHTMMLINAITLGDMDCILELLEIHDVNPNAGIGGFPVIVIAAKLKADASVFSALLWHGADPDAPITADIAQKGRTAADIAADNDVRNALAQAGSVLPASDGQPVKFRPYEDYEDPKGDIVTVMTAIFNNDPIPKDILKASPDDHPNDSLPTSSANIDRSETPRLAEKMRLYVDSFDRPANRPFPPDAPAFS